jgi:hypothetical protein
LHNSNIAVITHHDIPTIGVMGQATGFEARIEGAYSRAYIGF